MTSGVLISSNISAATEICPYPGLRPFGEREEDLFFGREQEIAHIVTLLEDRQLIVVHGASGCGKSSVVRAGVIPMFRLDALANGKVAEVIIVRPGHSSGPVAALAEKLDVVLPRRAAEVGTVNIGSSWSTILSASPDWRTEITAAARAANIALCLIIDQFEEIFTVAREGHAAGAAHLVRFLVSLDEPISEGTALGERSLSVIATMRSDYLGNCATWEGFAETVNVCQYLLPKISTIGALRAIHDPVRSANTVVTDDVADRLLAVISREQDGLPILQHALMRSWQAADIHTDGRVIDLATLDKIGGVDNALSAHADEIVAELVAQDLNIQAVVDWIFRSLSDIDTDRRIIRRPVCFSQLSDETGAPDEKIRLVLDTFRRPENGLISPFAPDPLGEDSIVTVGHESLLRQWKYVSERTYVHGHPIGLAYREFQDGMIWRSLAMQADDFTRNPKMVLSSATTEQRLPWYREVAKRPGWIRRHLVEDVGGPVDSNEQFESVNKLVNASEVSLKAERDRDQRDQRWIRFKYITLLLVICLLSSLYYFYQKNQIDEARAEIGVRIRTQSALQLANRYCDGRSNDAYVFRECVQSMIGHYYELLGNVKPADIEAQLVPQSPYSNSERYRVGGINGKVPQ